MKASAALMLRVRSARRCMLGSGSSGAGFSSFGSVHGGGERSARVRPSLVFRAASSSSLSSSSSSSSAAAAVPTGVVVKAAASSSSTAAAEADVDVLDPHVLDIRVGKVLTCERHADADSLYVEEIDVGEETPRTICSGLVSFMPASSITGSTVAVLCNLKARKMRGISSHGMLLCASNEAHDAVELLRPPEAAAAGERIRFAGGDSTEGDEEEAAVPREPETPNRLAKKKMWEALQPHLRTDDACVASFKGRTMLTDVGPVACDSLKGASIS